MKKIFVLLFVLMLLVGCTNGKEKENNSTTFKDHVNFSGTIIDMIDSSDSEGFFLVIEPTDSDHNSTIILKSTSGQVKETFTKDQIYLFNIYVIADTSSNRLDMSLVGFEAKK